MILKKRKVEHMNTMLAAQEHAARVKAALAKASQARPVVLATVPSSNPNNKPYRISLGGNNTVWCNCKGFQNRSACRHIERFRTETKIVEFK